LCSAWFLQEEHAQEFIRERFEKRLETLRVRRLAGTCKSLQELAGTLEQGHRALHRLLDTS
jgi:hypothetical protein